MESVFTRNVGTCLTEYLVNLMFVRASLHIRREEKPTRCH